MNPFKDFLRELPLYLGIVALVALLVTLIWGGRLKWEDGSLQLQVMATPVPAAKAPSGEWMWDPARKTKLDEPARRAGRVNTDR